nr:RNA-directed DNA polymerase, eukaryota [Tanacetum cinerariifolium]
MGATANRNSFRSFDDHTQRISNSMYVTNFPDSVNPRDLWNSCSAYGTVIDVFIPVKKSKAGKRFTFVRFIKVNNLDHLVENLCTIWIGRHHLFANKVQYERPQKSVSSFNTKPGANSKPLSTSVLHQHAVRTGSYANMVNGAPIAKNKNSSTPMFDLPALVLDEPCANDSDITHQVMGRVKDLNSIPNLKTILSKEGFGEIKLSYLGGMENSWILKSLPGLLLLANKFVSKPMRLLVFWKLLKSSLKDNELSVKDSDDEGVADTYLGENSSNDQEATQLSEDPFGFYKILKKPPVNNVRESDSSLTHPLGYTPEPSHQETHKEPLVQEMGKCFDSLIQKGSSPLAPKSVKEPSVIGLSSESSTSFHSRKTHNGGSILDVLDNVIKTTILKRMLWEYISALANRWNGETIVLGDFNEVCTEEERFSSIFNPSSARTFNQFIASSGLIEVKMEGYSFTWSHPSAYKMSKLDRFLVLDGIFLTFPLITAVCLDRHLSDHRPIFLHEIHADFGPILFRFYHSWLEREDCAKNSLIDSLVTIDKELDMGINSDDTLLRRLELSCKLFDLKQSDTKDVAQKAKVQWAIEGDENLKFFHGIINKRRAQLEIKAAVWACGANKSSGPYGYTFEFFRRYWDIIGSDFCAAVDWFFVSGSFPRGCNASFIALIPKVTDAKSRKVQALIFKVDFAKAYDSVRWDFLLDVLQSFGFGSRWCSWIRGVTVSDQMSHHSAWHNIIQKVRSRLSKWKVKTLSIGGHLTLLKSVLGAVPLYSMSIYKAPKGVLRELEMIRNSFFIGADSAEKKITCIAWDKVLALKKQRGLGVSSFYALNRALLLKWRNKEISVAAKWGDPSFDHSFRRQVRAGAERQQWADLPSLLGTFSLSPSIDRWVCDLNGDGSFRVKDFRFVLDDLILRSSNMATRWVKCVPVKVNVFAWRAWLERLPTRDNLAKRGVHTYSNLCPVCGSSPENIQHLLFGCDLAKKIMLDWELDLLKLKCDEGMVDIVDLLAVGVDQYEKLVIPSRAKILEKTHDPLALVAHTSSSSSRPPPAYYVTRPHMCAKGHYARDCPKARVRDSMYFLEQMLLAKKDEAGVILFNEQNDFLIDDAAQNGRD